ncbi:MAG: hypothetical protein HPZ91_02790 [Lentisphaeria bacterium]|nr:hypothetical protein [Lentisphaeria bacterium]
MKKFSLLPLLLAAALAAAEYNPSAADRKTDRPAELWRTYMHGVVDFFAAPVEVEFPTLERGEAEISNRILNRKFRTVKLGKQGRTSRPLPVNLTPYRGKTLRFFYWMKGDNTGRQPTPQSYNDCPQLAVILRDGRKKQLSRADSRNGAVGTFPWHCYYTDVTIPPRAETVEFLIRNICNGRAEFGNFSFEPVTAENTYTQDEKQDPDTGSNANFPWYEPMSFHFNRLGPGKRHTWNFLRGPAAGMIGQPYDLTTVEGLRKYYHGSVKVDHDQMNHGIMYFGNRINTARKHGVLPEGMPEDYLDRMIRIIIEDQDPETGYWGTQSHPRSMSCTFHLVAELFNFGIERTDEKAEKAAGGNRCIAPYLPNPEAMVKTTLKLQSTYRKNGETRLAAWSPAAYDFTENPDSGESRGTMGTTMNAIWLMRICQQFVNPELQKQIDRSVEAALRYMLEHATTPECLWTMGDDYPAPTRPAYFQRIMEVSHYLEKRTDNTMPKPCLTVAGDEVSCREWPERQNSIRIYAVPEGFDPAKLSSPQLIGVISRGESHMIEMDPLIAVRRCRGAALRNWGKNAFSPYLHYLNRKVVTELKPELPHAVKEGSLTLRPPAGTRLAATAADWYGRESEAVFLTE